MVSENLEERELRSYFDYMVKHATNSRFRIFLYKSRNHALICMLLGSCNKNDRGFSYEEICNLIPAKLASRTTVLTILQEGILLNYFVKEIDVRDKRKQLYKLQKPQKNRIVSWAHDMTKIFGL